MMVSIEQLDSAWASLARVPSTQATRAQRSPHLSVIQQAADAFDAVDYKRYRAAWQADPGLADAIEGGAPILQYLRQRTRQAMEEFRQARLDRGIAIWLTYNMGYLVRTPTAAFGIDLHFRGAEALAGDLDFLLTTHEHVDHFTPALMDAMLAAGKPVVSRWYPGSQVLSSPARLAFGDITVDVTIGDHHHDQPGQSDNMLIFCIRPATGGVILHAGDNSNVEKLPAGLRPDAFMFHISVGLPVETAVRRVDPMLALPAHVLELEHSPNPPRAWRWSFAYALKEVRAFEDAKAPVLSWGERVNVHGGP